MLKIMPTANQNIERLSIAMRNKNSINRADARMLHIADSESINMTDKVKRYYVRQEDGSILKMTLFDSFIKEEIFKKINNSYQRVSSRKIPV